MQDNPRGQLDAYQYVNPYIAGSPVTGTEMFFGRDDVFSFIRRNLIGQHRDTPIVLYGQRRTGKTSVLFQLHRHLDPRYLCLFIDMHALGVDSEANFLWGIANSISRGLKRDHEISVGVPDRAKFFADPRPVFETVFLDGVWPALGDNHLVLMMDEVARLDEEVRAGRLDREIFDYLRHLMQHFPGLNFVFSLGSGLEEMKKDYAYLFSVALYHRISFLEPGAARALITQPVREHYQVTEAAVEKILQITSGHPYYTQLVCHCMFDRWLRSPKPAMTGADVDAVLAEAIELGSANLTYVWEDSAPEEQAMMAGMAAVMRGRRHAVSVDHVREAWHEVGVVLPEGDAARAVRSLVSREVVAGERGYSFAVDLQRLWLEKHRRLDWVKEELAQAAHEWDGTGTVPHGDGTRNGQPPGPAEAGADAAPARPAGPARRRLPRRRLIITAVILAAAVTAVVLITMVLPSSALTAAPAVAAVQPDRLASTLLGAQFPATDVPDGTSALNSQLSDSVTSLTAARSGDQTPEANGLLTTIQTEFSGVGTIEVDYFVFDNLGDANSYFSTADSFPAGYRPAGSFTAAGIGDPTQCTQATGSGQTAWACQTLSDDVVSYSQVIESGTRNGASLESALALDTIRHLRSTAETTPSAPLPQPPGSAQASALYAGLDTAFPATLVPQGLSAPGVSTELNPAPGLLGPNKRISVVFQGSGPDFDYSYIHIFVFGTAQEARSWFGTDLHPENPLGKTDTATNHIPFPPSGFSSSRPAQCNTFTQAAVQGNPPQGISVCYIQWGNVVLAGATRITATADDKAPGAADSNLAITLAWAAILRVGQVIAP